MSRNIFLNAFCLFLLLSPGCGDMDSNEAQASNHEKSDLLIPTEVWLAEASDLDIIDAELLEGYTAHYQLNETTPITFSFDSSKTLYQAYINLGDSIKHTLFFDHGRVNYSEHVDEYGVNWRAAYANEKPFAAARLVNENWVATQPELIPISPTELSEALRKSSQAQSFEKNNKGSRVLSDGEIIGSLDLSGTKNFVLNALEGDLIEIDLLKANENVFFSLSTEHVTRMEHKKWKGLAKSTGDIVITVFTVDPDPSQKFLLGIKRVPRQIQVELPAKREV